MKASQEIGRELDLYIGSELVGTGLPLLTHKGATIKRELEKFILEEELKRGYQHTSTPQMSKKDLFVKSGHWEHYKENMFCCNVGNETFALRPMTCPYHFLLFNRHLKSYKELPVRFAEISTLFRNETTGALGGLTRLRQFTLSDAHIVCRQDQVETEFKNVIDLINYSMDTLGIDDIWYRFSLRDPQNRNNKYVDNPVAWEKTENTMKSILDNLGLNYISAEGEAAFYGPKLDLQYKNMFGKEETLITVQMDFVGAENFDMKFINSSGDFERPIVIHRSSIGSIERTMSYLLEKSQGNLPTWLSPIQTSVMNVSDKSFKYAQHVNNTLFQQGIRTEFDSSEERIGYKIREGIKQKIPYLLIVGEEEEKSSLISVRKRGEKENKLLTLEGLTDNLLKEIRLKIK